MISFTNCYLVVRIFLGGKITSCKKETICMNEVGFFFKKGNPPVIGLVNPVPKHIPKHWVQSLINSGTKTFASRPLTEYAANQREQRFIGFWFEHYVSLTFQLLLWQTHSKGWNILLKQYALTVYWTYHWLTTNPKSMTREIDQYWLAGGHNSLISYPF